MRAADRLRDAAWRWGGRLAFPDAVQRNLDAAATSRRDGRPRILLFEPDAPTLTLGRRAQTDAGRRELEATLGRAAEREIAVATADRGGLATLHLPGQLVVFVAIPEPLPPIRDLVCALLTAAREVAHAAGVEARIDADRDVGLWSERGKLASVGLRVRDRCALHGMSLNVAIDGDLGAGLVLCGSSTRGYDSIHRGLDGTAASRAVVQAAESLARASGGGTAALAR